MSWIIQSLLNNREQLRESGKIETDEFNDLMMIEKAIKFLRESNAITDEDLEILGFETSPNTLTKTRNEKQILRKKRAILCDRIAFYLGGYFTDEGYISYMTHKYKLDASQVETLREYTNSQYKHKLKRKPVNGNQK